jgi:hypothetical protein
MLMRRAGEIFLLFTDVRTPVKARRPGSRPGDDGALAPYQGHRDIWHVQSAIGRSSERRRVFAEAVASSRHASEGDTGGRIRLLE